MGRLTLLGVGSAGGSGQAQSSLLTGLAGYYKLVEASGATALDSLGVNDLANNGTVGTAAGRVGTSRVMSTGNYLSAASASAYDYSTGQAFTVAAWAYPTSKKAFGMVVAKDNSWVLRMDSLGTGWEFTDTVNPGARTPGVATLNAWHLLVARYDPSVGMGEFSLSVNGGASTGNAPAFPLGSIKVVQFGARDGANPFFGRVDEVGIWSRLLTAAEETTLYNAGAGTTYPF